MPEVFSAENKTKKVPDKHIPNKLGIDRVIDEAIALRNQVGTSLGSFLVMPKNAHFENQDDDEKIIFLMRKHVITNVKWIVIASILMFVPVFWGDFPFVAALDSETQFLLGMVWYLGLGFYAFEKLLLWYYNIFIVTDERIVDVDCYQFLSKNVAVTLLDRIEDVNYSQSGILASVYNYGNVIIETASEQISPQTGMPSPEFVFDSVPNPDKVSKIIMDLVEEERDARLERGDK